MIFRFHSFSAGRCASIAVSLGALLVLAGCAQPGVESNSLVRSGAVTPRAQSASRHLAQSGDNPTPRALDTTSDEPQSDPPLDDDASSSMHDCACGSTFEQTGIATWYGKRFNGRRTASGERYDMHALTAAHRTLPLGACVRVTTLGSARSVVVRINDRGPFVRGRVIDLSYAAAQALGLGSTGSAQVKLERVATARQARTAHGCQERGV